MRAEFLGIMWSALSEVEWNSYFRRIRCLGTVYSSNRVVGRSTS